jgi:nitroreductase
MNGATLSDGERATLISAAIAAPSIHNTQPWLFHIGDDTVEIYADPTRQLTEQDPDGRAMVISCGAAVLNVRVAAEHLGHQTKTEVLPDAERPDLIAQVYLDGVHPRGGMTGELHSAIAARRTNRGPYEDRPIPSPMLQALVEAARLEGAELHLVSTAEERERLVALMHTADSQSYDNSALTSEAARWVGVDDERADGIPRSALGPLPDDPHTPHRDLERGRPHGDRLVARFEEAPTLAVLTTPRDSRADWVMAGQALERVLLVATIEGLSATFANQPVEQPSLRWLVRDPDEPIGFPQMIMRLGYGQPVPPTPRRDISEVLLPTQH